MEIKFWKDREKKILRPELFSEDAEAWAKAIDNESEKDKEGKSKNNKSSQIRRFYDEVLRVESKIAIGQSDEDFERELPYLRMLNAKVNYAKARGLVSPKFVEFLKAGIGQVRSRDDFEAFKSFFEAFMGFSRGLQPEVGAGRGQGGR